MTCKACGQPYGCNHSDAEYQGIVPPRAPAIVEARMIVAAHLTHEKHKACKCREEIARGEWDRGLAVRSVAAAIEGRRGPA